MNATWGFSRIMLVVAAICFAVGLLITIGALQGNDTPFLFGGLLAWVLSALIP